MKRRARFTIAGALLVLASAALGACQSLAGIHDRTFDADASTGPSPECQEYCDLADQVCTDDNAIYASKANCLAVCALFPESDPNVENVPNSIACRTNQLRLQLTGGEPDTLAAHCASAGPGGNGVCGSNCASYCQLYAAACKAQLPLLGDTQYDPGTCEAKCKGLASTKTFSAVTNYDGDTLQCRLVHTSAAAQKPEEHCVHAQLQAQSQAKPPGPCLEDPGVKPDCDTYCDLEMTVCSGAQQIYENGKQCHAVCGALPLGELSDTKENTVGCRKYHSYNALVDPETHCAHTGPGGDGHCGSNQEAGDGVVTGNCESYCILLQKACAASNPDVPATDTFKSEFKSLAECEASCVKLDGAGLNSGYSVNPLPTGPTLQCRLLHVSRALSTPADDCAAALGRNACAN